MNKTKEVLLEEELEGFIIHGRFTKKILEEIVGRAIRVYFRTNYNLDTIEDFKLHECTKDNEEEDYSFIGNIAVIGTNGEPYDYGYVDIYYLKTRNEDFNIYITEVNVEFE